MRYWVISVSGVLMMLPTTFFASNDEQKSYLEQVYGQRSGYGIPSEESEYITNQGGAPTYGEITFESVQKLLDYLNLQAQDVIYDLGSGVGKFITQVYLATPVKKAVGVELSPTRINHAKAVKAQLESEKKLKPQQTLDFKQEDIGKADLSDATIVYMCSTCFSPELMKKIADNTAKSGAKNVRIVTLKQLPEDSNFELEKELKLEMTWTNSTSVYIYKRKGT